MSKNLIITSIILGLGFTAIAFQNCGAQSEFSNDGSVTQQSLLGDINDPSLLASDVDKREVLIEMDLVMNQDPRTVEEPMDDVMNINQETSEVTLRPEAETYLCKNANKLEKLKNNSKSNGQRKYMICHVPSGDYNKSKSKCLPEARLIAHRKKLGNSKTVSYMGPCK